MEVSMSELLKQANADGTLAAIPLHAAEVQLMSHPDVMPILSVHLVTSSVCISVCLITG
jgi:hypothetical protein